MDIAKYIDHTLLKPTAGNGDIENLCREAIVYKFHSVCINGCYVPLAYSLLKGTNISVGTVIGFPLGAMRESVKAYEAEKAIDEGATEVDMVLNIGFLKDGRHHEVLQEISFIKNVIQHYTLKVIIETCYLSDNEKIAACNLAVDAGADFVKTSTGFGTGGATFDDVVLMKKAMAGKAKIKASGGISDYGTAKKYIELGADRIGTSNGVQIIKSS